MTSIHSDNEVRARLTLLMNLVMGLGRAGVDAQIRATERGQQKLLPSESIALDQLGSTTLFIKTMAFFDDSLAFYISSHWPDIRVPPTLDGKMKLLEATLSFRNPEELHRLRRMRNSLAHNSNTAVVFPTAINALRTVAEELIFTFGLLTAEDLLPASAIAEEIVANAIGKGVV